MSSSPSHGNHNAWMDATCTPTYAAVRRMIQAAEALVRGKLIAHVSVGNAHCTITVTAEMQHRLVMDVGKETPLSRRCACGDATAIQAVQGDDCDRLQSSSWIVKLSIERRDLRDRAAQYFLLLHDNGDEFEFLKPRKNVGKVWRDIRHVTVVLTGGRNKAEWHSSRR